MMKVSRTVAYALHAVLQLAQEEAHSPVPCSRLAAAGEMPERFLLQILRSLVTHGILVSTRGVEGGYRLERDPADISLLEVIEAIDGPLNPLLPAVKGLPRECKGKLECVISSVTDFTRRELQAVKLAHLVSGGSGPTHDPSTICNPCVESHATTFRRTPAATRLGG
jgi:Rrf2 family protein